jgi:GrpB-like predicted nucleotidyltransferase (UPF0157 family)
MMRHLMRRNQRRDSENKESGRTGKIRTSIVPPLRQGLRGDEVRISRYRKRWPGDFDREKQLLRRELKALPFPVRIAHVGSTSVRGLAAKPIIDIALGVRNTGEVGQLLARLLTSGRTYVKAGNQPGMLLVAKGDPRRFFYHLVVVGSPAWDRLILVRDQLRRYPAIAQEYEAVKRAAAASNPGSRLAYADAKAPFIRAILNRAYMERRSVAATRAARHHADQVDAVLSRMDSGLLKAPPFALTGSGPIEQTDAMVAVRKTNVGQILRTLLGARPPASR